MLVKCNFRLNCILKQELRCYDLRSKSLKKPPFRPHFRLFCPHPAYGSSLRAQGCTHFLAPPTRTWHPRPPGHWSPAPGSTTPGPAGSGRAQTFPRWLLLSTDRGLTEIERGPISTIGLPYYSVCHRTGRPLRANQTFRRRSPVGAPGRGVGRPILRCATAATYPDAHQLASAYKLFWALASWCARTGGRRPFSEAQPPQFAHGCAPTGEHLRGYFLVERNSFRFSRLLADLHHLTTAKI